MPERFKLIVASVTQTGDIPHIAGALALRSNIDALILHDASVDIQLLKALYQRAADVVPGSRNDRVNFLSVPTSPGGESEKKLYGLFKYCFNLLKLTAAKETFETILGKTVYAAFEGKYLAKDSNNDKRSKFSLLKLTEATGEIAKAYRAKRIESYELAARGFIFDPVQLPLNSIISKDGKLGNILLPPVTKNPVLLVWARYTGTKTDTGFNPEGDSDPTGQKQLVASATKLGFVVITIGDVPSPEMTSIVNNEPYQLGEFWMQTPLVNKGRAAQCSFFAALMQRYPGNLYQIGQKTGAMDFPALLGVPTIYIEDSQISTTATGHMRQWTRPDSLQLYRRLEVEDPPSLPGKGARRFTETFYSEDAATEVRRTIKESKYRMVGLLFNLRGKWTNITSLKEPECISDIVDVVTEATDQDLQTWKTKINALSDEDCQNEDCIRGYTAADLKKVEEALGKLKTDYVGDKMIIRDSDGAYKTRK